MMEEGARVTADQAIELAADEPLDVIVVGGDLETLSVLTTIFEANGWRARWSASAVEARAMILARAPDVVITDLQRGPHGGATLALEIHEAPTTRHVAVLLVTAEDTNTNVTRAFDACLQNPVDPHTLVDTISLLGAGSRFARRRAPG
jgi:CheY-like chemotaxis protein